MLIDYHIHTNYTIDAKGTVDDFCKSAIAKGFKNICFTNHQEWSSVADRSFKFAISGEGWQQYMAEIESAREKYPELRIGFGVELGYIEQWEKDIVSFPKKYPFDYVLGSLHWVNGRLLSGIAKEKPVHGLDIAEIYREYFRLLNKIIKMGFFDCIAHFDIVKKNLPRVPFSEYRDEVVECIDSMKEHDIGFELNTMGLNHHCRECYPSPEILQLLQKLGIRKVTIGSDSHSPEMLGYKINQGIDMLKKTGFSEICTFSKRKAEYHKS